MFQIILAAFGVRRRVADLFSIAIPPDASLFYNPGMANGSLVENIGRSEDLIVMLNLRAKISEPRSLAPIFERSARLAISVSFHGVSVGQREFIAPAQSGERNSFVGPPPYEGAFGVL